MKSFHLNEGKMNPYLLVEVWADSRTIRSLSMMIDVLVVQHALPFVRLMSLLSLIDWPLSMKLGAHIVNYASLLVLFSPWT